MEFDPRPEARRNEPRDRRRRALGRTGRRLRRRRRGRRLWRHKSVNLWSAGKCLAPMAATIEKECAARAQRDCRQEPRQEGGFAVRSERSAGRLRLGGEARRRRWHGRRIATARQVILQLGKSDRDRGSRRRRTLRFRYRPSGLAAFRLTGRCLFRRGIGDPAGRRCRRARGLLRGSCRRSQCYYGW